MGCHQIHWNQRISQRSFKLLFWCLGLFLLVYLYLWFLEVRVPRHQRLKIERDTRRGSKVKSYTVTFKNLLIVDI